MFEVKYDDKVLSSKVYYIPFDTKDAFEKALFSFECVLTYRMYHLMNIFFGCDLVGIKIDTKNDILPSYIKYANLIGDLLNKRDASPFICDTSEHYKNKRENAVKHMRFVEEKILSETKSSMQVIMLDGSNSNYELVVELSSKLNDRIMLSGELQNIDGLAVITSPKKDKLSGFAGSIYHMGFGLASSNGKMKFLSMTKPKTEISRCYLCRRCIHVCPVDAIKIVDSKIKINKAACIDCGKCVNIATHGGIYYEWNATSNYFKGQLIKYAKVAKQTLNDKMLFVNLLKNNDKEKGILLSSDPVAVDKASIDLCFEKNLSLDLLNRAKEEGLGNLEYELITINY